MASFAPRAAAWLLGLAVLVVGAAATASAATHFVFFEVADGQGGVDLHVQRLAGDGAVGWEDKGKPLPFAATAGLEGSPAACPDGSGGAICAYVYEFAAGENKGDLDVVAQRIDAAGKPLWSGGKSPVPVGGSKSKETSPGVLPDGTGGAFVVYEWTDAKGDTDLVAQRLSAEGKPLWNEGEPVAVASSDRPERAATLLPDGAGGLLVVFEWVGEKGDSDVMAQRLSGDGKPLWNKGEQATDICATDHAERNVSAISDGQGGAIVALEIEYLEGEHKGDADIVAQRLAGDGKLLWNDGKPMDVSTSDALERSPRVVPDGQGGALVAFEYTAREGEDAGDQDIAGQRVSAEGKALWGEGKALYVGSAKHRESNVRGVSLADGGVIWAYELEFQTGENKGDLDLMAQRLGPDGKAQWHEGKKSAALASAKWLERGVQVFPDGEGGLVAFYTATGPEGKFQGDMDVEATRLSGDGKLLWENGERPVDIAAADVLERNPCAVLVSE